MLIIPFVLSAIFALMAVALLAATFIPKHYPNQWLAFAMTSMQCFASAAFSLAACAWFAVGVLQ
jgi:hypothetical protein